MFSFGTDPEFILHDGKRHVSAIGIIPGTKKKRIKIGRHEFYYDNVLAEAAVCPAKSKDEMMFNLRECLKIYVDLVAPNSITFLSAMLFEPSQLNHVEAQKAGCDPEICAYILDEIQPPECKLINGTYFMKTPLRTAGGHIHLGTPVAKIKRGEIFITRMLDLFLGTASVFIDQDPTASTRKTLYGKAGRFRRPKYGVEYRTLGNFWLRSPALFSLVYDICEFVISFVKQGKHLDLWFVDEEKLDPNNSIWDEEDFDPAKYHICTGYDVGKLREAIDTNDRAKAKEFLTFIGEILPNSIFEDILEACQPVKYDFQKEWEIR